MANTSTLNYLNGQIMKAFRVNGKSEKNAQIKPVFMIPLKYSLKPLTLMIVYFRKEWSCLERF